MITWKKWFYFEFVSVQGIKTWCDVKEHSSPQHAGCLYILIKGFYERQVAHFWTFMTQFASNFFIKCQKLHKNIPAGSVLTHESVWFLKQSWLWCITINDVPSRRIKRSHVQIPSPWLAVVYIYPLVCQLSSDLQIIW